MKKTFVFFLIGFATFTLGFSQANVKIMTYNLLNFTESATNRTPYFKTVIDYVNPDILVVQEMVSLAALNIFYSQALNASYSKGVFIDGPDSDNAIFYKSELFTFVSTVAIPTTLRNIGQFTLVHKLSGDTLRIYSAHLKASTGATNEAQRAAEVNILRGVTNQLPSGKNFIVCGDFNIYKATEQAYINLTAKNGTNNGYFIDPFTMPGTWNNSNYAQYHTQSPRARQFGGGATGGLDDRFDLMLYSQAIADQGGMQYVSNSTWAVGNDGNHYNDSINSPTNFSVPAAVANALFYAADHLPVVASFSFEIQPIIFNLAIQLNAGWNSISGYIDPSNKNVAAMLSPIENNLIVLKNLSQVYWPKGGVNTLQNWNYQSGYVIKVNSNTTLSYAGTMPANKNVQINQGWNLIPVLSQTPVNITAILGSNVSRVEIIKDVVGYQVYWPGQDIYTLMNFQPEKSYYLKANQPFIINF